MTNYLTKRQSRLLGCTNLNTFLESVGAIAYRDWQSLLLLGGRFPPPQSNLNNR